MTRKNRTQEYKEIETALLEFLDKTRRRKRLEIIDELLHSLNFARRVAMLTNEEMAHMCNQSLSPAAKKGLDEAATEEERDELFTMYARSNFFRRCAWADYLNGVTEQKPLVF